MIMVTDYDAIKTKVDEKLKEWGVRYSVRTMGETVRDNDWECDAWRVVFCRGVNANQVLIETDYFTDTGHRKQVVKMPVLPYRKGTLAYEEWARRAFKPITPRAADVLYSLLLDGEAANQSFNDWCAEYDYDNDSVKALTTYQACCKIGKDLRKVFTPDQREMLREMLQDF